MRESFCSFLVGFLRHSWAFWIGFVLAVLDIGEHLFPQRQLSTLSQTIGWIILAIGFFYAAWRTYHDLWLSLPADERAAIGYLKFTDAPNYLLDFIDEDALEQWDGDQHYTKVAWASTIFEDIVEHENIDVYERLSETRFRKIDYEDAEKQSFKFGDEASNTFYVRKRDLRGGWKRYAKGPAGSTRAVSERSSNKSS
ncbi:MAG: hypothetical protein ACE5FO_01135 [Parvularculaceae bacterium]